MRAEALGEVFLVAEPDLQRHQRRPGMQQRRDQLVERAVRGGFEGNEDEVHRPDLRRAAVGLDAGQDDIGRVGAAEREPLAADGFQIRAHEKVDIVTARSQLAAVIAADGAGADNRDARMVGIHAAR